MPSACPHDMNAICTVAQQVCSQRDNEVLYSTMLTVAVEHNGDYGANTSRTCSQESGGRGREQDLMGTVRELRTFSPIEYSYT